MTRAERLARNAAIRLQNVERYRKIAAGEIKRPPPIVTTIMRPKGKPNA